VRQGETRRHPAAPPLACPRGAIPFPRLAAFAPRHRLLITPARPSCDDKRFPPALHALALTFSAYRQAVKRVVWLVSDGVSPIVPALDEISAALFESCNDHASRREGWSGRGARMRARGRQDCRGTVPVSLSLPSGRAC